MGPENLMDKEKLEAMDRLNAAVVECVKAGLVVANVIIDPHTKMESPNSGKNAGAIVVEVKSSNESFKGMGRDMICKLIQTGINAYVDGDGDIMILNEDGLLTPVSDGEDNPFDFGDLE